MKILKQQLKQLDVDSLHICDSYQRTVRKSAVNKIVKYFDPDALGSLSVGERPDGTDS